MSDTQNDDFILDLSAVEDPNAPVPPGRYKGTLENAEATRSKSGNPMVVWTYQTENGRELRDYTTLHVEFGRFRAKQALAALGVDVSKPVDIKGILPSLVGREVILELVQEENSYNKVNADTGEEEKVTRMQNKIRSVLPLT